MESFQSKIIVGGNWCKNFREYDGENINPKNKSSQINHSENLEQRE